MSFAKVRSAQTTLLTADIIDVEIDVAKGLHAFSVVGLPDKAVEESRDRVSAAIRNSGYKPPKATNKKIIVSLAPADIRKEGPQFDLPIALAYLLASEYINFDPNGKLFVGELALNGLLREVAGILPIAQAAAAQGFSELYVPNANAEEAALITGITVYGIDSLTQIITHLTYDPEDPEGTPSEETLAPTAQTIIDTRPVVHGVLDDIRGQAHAKRGIEIAAAGGHNIALYGPPGTGKTMLASALAELLPPLRVREVLEVTGIHSVSGILDGSLVTHAPFRSPHHTASYVSIVGGGASPKPGEVTLAHRGVLFLDEFPEFDKKVINALRQPLEDGMVSISRAKGTARFPSNFILIAAMNPCPCGYFGTAKCSCSPIAFLRYQEKISGPIIDRIDMWIEVGAIDHEQLVAAHTHAGEETKKVRDSIASARRKQIMRFKDSSVLHTNSDMGAKEIQAYAPLEQAAQTLLTQAAKRMDLSPRAYHRVIKLARTIADIAESVDIDEDHILEALQYRPKTKRL